MASDISIPVRRFLTWWLGELRASVPRPLSGLLFGSDSVLEVHLDADEIRFDTVRAGRRAELGSVALDGIDAKRLVREVRYFLRPAGSASGRIIVRLPGTKVLRPKADLPTAAALNIRDALSSEMDRHTPFASDEVLFDFRVSGSDPELERIAVDLEVARKSDVEKSVAFLRDLGISPSRVTGPAHRSPAYGEMNLLPEADRPRESRLLPRLTAVAAVAAVIAAGAALYAWIDRQDRLLDRTEARLTELRVAAGGAARKLETIERLNTLLGAVASERGKRPLMVEILGELTARLPDRHWLAELNIRGNVLTISGFSSEPSEILRLLDESEMLNDVRFGSPVTRDQIGRAHV